MNARLHIEAAVKAGHTFLKTAYGTPPFKVADITEDKREKSLRIMLMSASPGILDGDTYHIKIDVKEKASLYVQTQSYQRLFQMKDGATQLVEVYLEADSSFTFLANPVVPHQGSRFFNHTKIFLSKSNSFLWGEVLTPGRQMRCESFTFSKYHSLTEVFQNGKLVVKENLLLQPGVQPVTGIGQLEGYTHQATLLYLQEGIDMPEKKAVLMPWLSAQQNVVFGISLLPVNGLIVRLLGYSGEQLHQCITELAELLSVTTVQTVIHEKMKTHVR